MRVERMYAASPHWRFEAARPPRRSATRARKVAIGVGAALVIVFGLSKTVAGEGPGGYTSYRVQPGDTLWSIAAERYAGADVRVRVGEIEKANGLDSPVIVPGEVLKVPQS
jgi:nucleoid-associated protein YgaU